jgi:hypothetical protein
MTKFVIATSIAAAALVSISTTAEAGPLPQEHDGFFLRLTPGFSALAAAADQDGVDVSLSGTGGSFGVNVGFALAPGKILSLDLAQSLVFAPTLKIGDAEFDSDDDVEFGLQYAGVAGTMYFGASNFYLTGGLGAMILTFRAPGTEDAESDVGFGARVGVGKEWWVTPNWGMGVAGELVLGSVTSKDEVSDEDLSFGVASINLAFSATYN